MAIGLTNFLVDTNIFIYAYLCDDISKSQLAKLLLEEIVRKRVGCVSTQVLNEVFSRLTRGVQDPSVIAEFAETITVITLNYQVLDTTKDTVLTAVNGTRRYQISYWDSLIWAAAKLNGVPYVLSEDFSHGQTLDGVTFLNPFTPGFTLEGHPA